MSIVDPTPGRDEQSGPVQRTLAILELLGDPEVGALGVVEIARALGRDKSQVSRALRVLAETGFVDREPQTRRYRLGAKLFAIATAAVDRRLRSESDRLVRRLSALLGERVEVSVPSGIRAVTIATCAPDNSLQAVGWVGRTFPLHCTAAGRCLLFDFEAGEIARLLTQVGMDGQNLTTEAGPGAPRSLDEVLRRVDTDRTRGWSLAEEETDRGLLAVAAPVYDAVGRIIAAVNASGPESRLRHRQSETVSEITHAATTLSSALGREPIASRDDAPPTEPHSIDLGRRPEGAR